MPHQYGLPGFAQSPPGTIYCSNSDEQRGLSQDAMERYIRDRNERNDRNDRNDMIIVILNAKVSN